MDGKMVAWELVQLALVSLFPFSNALLGEHGGRVLTSVVYATHLLLLALVSWRRSTYILRHPELHADELSPEQCRILRTRSWLLVSCCISTLVLAFFVPGWNTLAMLPTFLMSRLAR